MEYEPLLTDDDVSAIKTAVRAWGKEEHIVVAYGEALLHRHIRRWQTFVAVAWDSGDEDEYAHDIGVRFWLQLALEHATPPTQSRLSALIGPADDAFKQRMVPSPQPAYASPGPFAGRPYFWETHTLVNTGQ